MRRKILLTLIPVVFFGFVLGGCEGGEKTGQPPAPVSEERVEEVDAGIKAGKEILVARDVGRGSDVYPVFWCGNDSIVVRNERIGIELVSVPSGESVNVSPGERDHPYNCTPDGEWVVYVKSDSIRLNKPGEPRPFVYDGKPFEFDPGLDVWPVWEGYVADLFRYEVATGKSQRFAVVRSDLSAAELVSPDGSKILLGERHNSAVEMPEPGWDPVWTAREDWDWSLAEARWFKDSSGVVSLGYMQTNRLFVEFFGEGGWTKRFIMGGEYKDHIFGLKVDGDKRIYFLVSDGNLPNPGTYYIHRCELKDRELACEKILERDYYINPYSLHNGDIIFKDEHNNCIRRVSPGEADGECILDLRYGEDVYSGISLHGISLDGRRLLFERSKKVEPPEGRFFGYRSDLFILELSD